MARQKMSLTGLQGMFQMQKCRKFILYGFDEKQARRPGNRPPQSQLLANAVKAFKVPLKKLTGLNITVKPLIVSAPELILLSIQDQAQPQNNLSTPRPNWTPKGEVNYHFVKNAQFLLPKWALRSIGNSSPFLRLPNQLSQ